MHSQGQVDDFKQLRAQHSESIRRQSKEEILSKRRCIDSCLPNERNTMSAQEPQTKKVLIVDERLRDVIQEYYQAQLRLINAYYSNQMFEQLCENIRSEELIVQHRGIIGLRKIMSSSDLPPIQKLVDSQMVPVLIEMSRQQVHPQLQLQASWLLTNVASGNNEQCQSILKKGALEIFITQLIENKPGIIDQAIWAIGNIAGDCAANRDKALLGGALPPIVHILETTKNLHNIQQCAWALSNLCRGTPLPKYQLVKKAVAPLCKAVMSGVLDEDNLADSVWAISYLSETQKSKIQRVIETGVIPVLVSLCKSDKLKLMLPAIRVIGNVSSGNELQTEQLLKAGLLHVMTTLLDSQRKSIRREACWILSNVCAGPCSQVSQVISQVGILPRLLSMFQHDANDVKREICYVFSNMAHMGNPQDVFAIVRNNNVLEGYAMLIFQDEDTRSLEIALECLYSLLTLDNKLKTSKDEPSLLLFDLRSIPNMIDRLENLQYSQSQKVYQRIIKLLQRYFQLETTAIR